MYPFWLVNVCCWLFVDAYELLYPESGFLYWEQCVEIVLQIVHFPVNNCEKADRGDSNQFFEWTQCGTINHCDMKDESMLYDVMWYERYDSREYKKVRVDYNGMGWLIK